MVCVVPPFEAPDESAHLQFVNFVAARLALPNQYDPTQRLEQGHQLPLYYLLAGLAVRATQGDHRIDVDPTPNPRHAWHGGTQFFVPVFDVRTGPRVAARADRIGFYGLRLLSVAFGLLIVLIAERMVALAVDDAGARLVGTLFVATLPQLVFITSVVSADGLVALLCTGAGWSLLRALRDPDDRRVFVGTGVWLGLAIAAKKTALFLVPTALIVFVVRALRWPRPGVVVRRAGLTVFTAALLSSFVFARHYVVYGELLGSRMELETRAHVLRQPPLSLWDPYFVTEFPRILGASFVGVFGWMSVWLPRVAYLAYLVLAVLVALGVLRALVRAPRERWAVWVAGLAVGGCLAGIVVFNTMTPQPQGRYLFPTIGFVAILVAAGMRELLALAGRRRGIVAAAVLATFAAVDVASIVALLRFYGAG